MRGRKIAAALCNILGILILLSVIATFIPVTIPRLMGYQAYNIISGSMEPEIPVGSLVYVEPAQPAEVREGEIIVFYSGGSAVTHRVVQNRLVEGEFVTKGDANQQEDLNTISFYRAAAGDIHQRRWKNLCGLLCRMRCHVQYAGSQTAGQGSGKSKRS